MMTVLIWADHDESPPAHRQPTTPYDHLLNEVVDLDRVPRTGIYRGIFAKGYGT
jgi:hypothetical protein